MDEASLIRQFAPFGTQWRGGARRGAVFAGVWAVLCIAPSATQTAIANGETRTISLMNPHTNESGSFTYMVGGAYDGAVLDKLNWFLRDWRLNETTKMDPKLFDIVWEVYRASGSSQTIEVLSGYRSPSTNAMLRMRSRQVAEHSQHMLGKAMDAHFVDVGTAKIRDIGMRMQSGGVGFYPTGNTPWVHLDSGSVRYWPRMSRDSLVRLFPDGKTVHVPADGVPLAGYEQARAEIEARGGAVMTASAGTGGGSNFGIFGWLFGRGGGADDAEERAGVNISAKAAAKAAKPAVVEPPKTVEVAKAAEAQKPTLVASLEPTVAADGAPTDLHQVRSLGLLAPLPPRRPGDRIAPTATYSAPLPPIRPGDIAADLKLAAVDPKADLIAALLARREGPLPSAITRGAGGATAPKNALALAETLSPDAQEHPALAKAAALAAPLFVRPTKKLDAVKRPEIAAASPKPQVVAANPYGALVFGFFDGAGAAKDQSATVSAALRAADP